MNVGLVGAGFIGNKRAAVFRKSGDKLVAVADFIVEKSDAIAKNLLDCEVFKNWQQLVTNPKIEAVIVSTTHDSLAQISLAALKNNKHVLCEKPLGISLADVQKCAQEANKKQLIYKGGYNHRFHPAIFKAHELFSQKKIGDLMYIKATYGHGGRFGYEKEWRMDKKISGGGELHDQGAHLIDLSLWFMGEPDTIKSELTTSFWQTKVEDNAFLLLRNKNVVAQLHASWTEWKNRFIFEIYGTDGYLKINGLGGSYRLETLIFGERIPGKPPKEKIWEFPGEDLSWTKEWQNFTAAIKDKNKLLSSEDEGLKVLKIIQKIYETQK